MARLLKIYDLEHLKSKIEGFNAIATVWQAFGGKQQGRWSNLEQQTYMIDLMLQTSGVSVPKQVQEARKEAYEAGHGRGSAIAKTMQVLFEDDEQPMLASQGGADGDEERGTTENAGSSLRSLMKSGGKKKKSEGLVLTSTRYNVSELGL